MKSQIETSASTLKDSALGVLAIGYKSQRPRVAD